MPNDVPSFPGVTEHLDGLLNVNFMETLAAQFQSFVELDRGILHPFVRLGRTADQEKMLTSGDPVIAVLIVETDSNKADYLTFLVITFVIGHRETPTRGWKNGAKCLNQLYECPKNAVNCKPSEKFRTTAIDARNAGEGPSRSLKSKARAKIGRFKPPPPGPRDIFKRSC